ncbi:MAG: D-alanine--D-alanine ligase [Deltaproteobacteria bacterium]|nr:D-alanine--D-alanine ligase [Deltaproteobacteria bacterium]
MNKLNLGVIFGGKSAEHEISLISAKNIIDAANKDKYNIYPIGINKRGEFWAYSEDNYILNFEDVKKVSLNNNGIPVTFSFGENKELIGIIDKNIKITLDVIFPVLHGTYGEDGTIQGLFEMANIPYVGAGVTGSAIGMDKDIAKTILEKSGVNIAKFKCFNIDELEKISFHQLVKKLGLPFFLKPAKAGSSVGIYKIKDENDFIEKIKDAFRFSNKILFEEAIVGREIECSLLGNENPKASLPGEVIPNDVFYSYDAKYVNENGATFKIPVKLSDKLIETIQKDSIRIYKLLHCEGMARVDGFITKNEQYVFNEINTIPGFTSISMYPKLWNVSGIPTDDLIDRLIQYAIEKYNRNKNIKTSIR